MTHYLYIDFETFASSKVTLRKMTLQAYLAATHITSMAWAVDTGEVHVSLDPAGDSEVMEFFEWVANADDWVVVAHNAGFDLRVWRDLLGISWPARAQCSMGLARAAWPCQPGPRPYSLNALSAHFGIGTKVDFDPVHDKHEGPKFEEYVAQDVVLCREIHTMALPRVWHGDVRIAELCNRSREIQLDVDPDRATDGIITFAEEVENSAESAMCMLAGVDEVEDVPDEVREAFGWDGGRVKSVKPQRIKDLLADRFGFFTESISEKKIEPGKLARNEEARDSIKGVSATNKMLSHVRRVAAFSGMRKIDVELTEFAAHTFRYASTNVGKGVNFLNMPKHDKKVAKPIRSIFRLPSEYCWVRSDAANAEYRIEGWLANCEHTEELFSGDLFADPYLTFGHACTGIWYDKDDPVRQIWKSAVLGLGFLMGVPRFMSELMQAAGKGWIKLSVFDDLVAAQGWRATYGKRAGAIEAHRRKIGAPTSVAIVAFHAHKAFHRVHPEFKKLANWLQKACEAVAASRDPEAALDRLYTKRNAPDRSRLDLRVDWGLEGRSIRVQCGDWGPTMVWRDIAVRPTKYGVRLTSMAGGHKGYRALTGNILLENVTQACARNAMCKAMLELEEDYPYQMCVHDEIMLLTERTHGDIEHARGRLTEVGGPDNSLGYGHDFLLNPSEITVSESWYDGDKGFDWGEFWDGLSDRRTDLAALP